MILDQVSDPAGQHPGLARSGTGNDEDRPVNGSDGLTLGRVEPLKKVGFRHGARVYGHPAPEVTSA